MGGARPEWQSAISDLCSGESRTEVLRSAVVFSPSVGDKAVCAHWRMASDRQQLCWAHPPEESAGSAEAPSWQWDVLRRQQACGESCESAIAAGAKIPARNTTNSELAIRRCMADRPHAG